MVPFTSLLNQQVSAPAIPTLAALQKQQADLEDVQSQTDERKSIAAHNYAVTKATQQKATQDANDQAAMQAAFLESDGDEKKYLDGMAKRGVSQSAMFSSVKELAAHREQVNKANDEERKVRAAVAAEHASQAGALLSMGEAAASRYPELRDAWRKEGVEAPEDFDPNWVKYQQNAGMLASAQIKAAQDERDQKNKDQQQGNANAAADMASQKFDTELPALQAEAAAKTAINKSTLENPGLLTPDQQRQADAQTATQGLAQKKFEQDLLDFSEKVRHNKADEQEMQRYHSLSVDPGVTLTPQAEAKMAEMFATTGVLPAMGTGKAAAAARSRIMNAAAQNFPNVDFASNKAAYQANTTSLKNLQKQQDSIESFENTAGKNLDQFLETAKGVVDSGSPLVNAPLRTIAGTAFGGKNQKAFDVARKVAVTEIARVLNNQNGSAALSDSARKEVQELIGPNATLKQIVAASEILRSDMKNRLTSSREQIKAIQDRIGGGGSNELPGGITIEQIDAEIARRKGVK